MTRGVVALPAGVADALTDAFGRRSHQAAAAQLSERYRAGAQSAGAHVVRTEAELAAYAAVRFPATYAAAVAAFEACAAADADFAPASLLDVGAGLGATACAALAVWPSIETVTCVESDPRVRAAGVATVTAAGVIPEWVGGNATRPAPCHADLVTAGYVLTELGDPIAVAQLWWEATRGVLVVLEPGRTEAYRRLLDVRAMLLEQGAHTLAPCPHDERCPLPPSDWCHFGQRLPRTAQHRLSKGGDQPYEDEKYSYVAVTRAAVPPEPADGGSPPTPVPARIVGRPERRKGLVQLRLCRPERTVTTHPVPKSSPDYRAAKDAGWGDTWPASPSRSVLPEADQAE